jgi:hypothetical protein
MYRDKEVSVVSVDLKGKLEALVRWVALERVDLLADKDQEDPLDLLERMVCLEKMASPEHKERGDNQDHQDLLANGVFLPR